MIFELKQWLETDLNINNAKEEKNLIKINDMFFGFFDYNKSLKMSEDCRLIIFHPHEWINKNSQVKNFIKSVLNKNLNTIYARKCTVVSIEKSIANKFINENHLQGYNNLGLYFSGLLFNNELVGVMSLGRHNRHVQESDMIVLDRLCFKYDYKIIGGASKLLKNCILWAKKNKYKKIISFSDNRISKGNVYEKMGFELERIYKSDYFYVDNTGNYYSKQSQKKQNSNCPTHLKEKEWAEQRGFKPVFDFGKKRWILKLDPNSMSWKEKLSLICSKQHTSGQFLHKFIRGYFPSKKNNKKIYFSSSYELRCIYLLENNNSILQYKRHEPIKINNRYRSPDLLVHFTDGHKEVWEIKPEKLIKIQRNKNQIEDLEFYCHENEIKFKIWTEKDADLDDKEITKWAIDFLKENKINNIDYESIIKENQKIRSKKHYINKLSKKINFFCPYCQEEHSITYFNYKRNIGKNKRYICSKESNKKKKNKSRKITIIDNKKSCSCCKQYKDVIEFGKDKTHYDGLSTRCKECRRNIAKKNYKRKTNK